MRITRVISGFGMLFSSALWSKVIENVTGYTNLFGWVAITSVLAFLGGMIFLSGVRSNV